MLYRKTKKEGRTPPRLGQLGDYGQRRCSRQAPLPAAPSLSFLPIVLYLETSTTAMPPSAMDTPVFRRLRSRSSSARDERGTPSARRTLRSGRRSLIPLPYSYIHSFTAQIAPCSPPHPEAACFSESASYSHTCSLAKGRGRQHNTSYLLRIITLCLSTTHHHRLVPESHCCGLDQQSSPPLYEMIVACCGWAAAS